MPHRTRVIGSSHLPSNHIQPTVAHKIHRVSSLCLDPPVNRREITTMKMLRHLSLLSVFALASGENVSCSGFVECRFLRSKEGSPPFWLGLLRTRASGQRNCGLAGCGEALLIVLEEGLGAFVSSFLLASSSSSLVVRRVLRPGLHADIGSFARQLKLIQRWRGVRGEKGRSGCCSLFVGVLYYGKLNEHHALFGVRRGVKGAVVHAVPFAFAGD